MKKLTQWIDKHHRIEGKKKWNKNEIIFVAKIKYKKKITANLNVEISHSFYLKCLFPSDFCPTERNEREKKRDNLLIKICWRQSVQLMTTDVIELILAGVDEWKKKWFCLRHYYYHFAESFFFRSLIDHQHYYKLI